MTTIETKTASTIQLPEPSSAAIGRCTSSARAPVTVLRGLPLSLDSVFTSPPRDAARWRSAADMGGVVEPVLGEVGVAVDADVGGFAVTRTKAAGRGPVQRRVPHFDDGYILAGGGSVLRVIGAGFGRTGTLSFKRALEDLGFGPTYHMQEVMRRPSHIERWLRYAHGGDMDWDDLFSGFGSGVDYPVSCVWDELASHFPDAKVVLTVRDPQLWWASTASTIYRFRTAFPAWMLRSVPVTRHFVEMVDRLVWDGIFDGRFTDRDSAVGVFERHVERVRAICPPERLLVFDVADGWEPLCAFLEVPVPQHPFPHLNDAKVTRRVVNTIWWGTRVVPVIAATAAAGMVVRRRS